MSDDTFITPEDEPLGAIPMDAGTYPARLVYREVSGGTRLPESHEKGGWIELLWQNHRTREYEVRMVHVSTARAKQAVQSLAAGVEYV